MDRKLFFAIFAASLVAISCAFVLADVESDGEGTYTHELVYMDGLTELKRDTATDENTSVSMPANYVPSKSGYLFAGWGVASDSATATWHNGDNITVGQGEKRIYAVRTAMAAITAIDSFSP